MTTTMMTKKWLTILLLSLSSAKADLVISEVSDSGTSNACDGEDWVEIFNSGPNAEDMTGFIVTDKQDLSHPDTFSFPAGYQIEADTYLVLCGGKNDNGETNDGNATALPPFQFGIADDDTVYMIHVESGEDGTTLVETVSVVGPFPGASNKDVDDVTYALDLSTGLYNYTSTPTPGQANIISPIPTKEQLVQEKKAQLTAQNDLGVDFFNFDRQGMAMPNGMDPIVELKVTMDEATFQEIVRNPQYLDWYDVESVSVVTEDGVELATLSDPGRIRTRGVEEAYLAACMKAPLPFRLDFDNINADQTLFGVPKVHLRHALLDPSHLREWAYPRMLARFGLPHVRTRLVSLYINERFQGLYTLNEQPEEEYVFARNFPDYDPFSFALFQSTALTKQCGLYTKAQLERADDRVNELSTPPYEFQRGEHKQRATILGEDQKEECQQSYQEYLEEVLMADVVLAYVRHEEDCADLFLKEGLMDQELGTDNWDKEIKSFIENYMSGKRCDSGCENSGLADDVDLENFLKMFAFYAVALNLESPMGGVDNFYLVAQSDTDKKWKLLSFDFDKPGAAGCNDEVCDSRLIHWDITRPTCESLESNSLVGPLLSSSTLMDQYLGYVKEFLDDVYTNAAFIEEIESHAKAIEEAVKSSFGGGASFQDELSPDASNWDSGNFPLLATMKARAEDVQKQLAAIEDGSAPRDQGVDAGGSEVWESCPDWQLSEPDRSACEEGCKYQGCLVAGWTVEYFCDEATGTCYHGDEDMGCAGVADGETYPGLETRDDRTTFCRFAGGVPAKTSECPRVGEAVETATDAAGTSSGSGGILHTMNAYISLGLASLFLGQLFLNL